MTMRGLTRGMTALLIALTGPALAVDDAATLLKRAQAGDYESQRNLSYVLFHGEGIPKNIIEACAWRVVIVSSQHAKVVENDISALDIACGSQTVMDAAVKRSASILKAIPARSRTLGGDLSDLSENRCSETNCASEWRVFEGLYRKATQGDIGAMRQVARCFSERCDHEQPFDLFHACTWARLVLTNLGGHAERSDRVRENNTCGIISARARPIADVNGKQLLKLSSGNHKAR